MTIDPTVPLLVDMLPRDSRELYKALTRANDDRDEGLGCDWWRILRDAYQGTGGFARSVASVSTRYGGTGNTDLGWTAATGFARDTYLTPFSRESARNFNARAARSAYQNHVAPVVDVYHGHLVRRAPRRESTSPVVAEWWTDVDGAGHDIGEWVASAALRAQLYGWCAVLVDRPDVADGPVRTTVTALEPEELYDWQIGRDGRFDWVRIVSEICETDPATGVEVEYLEASIWTRAEWARVRMVEREGEGESYDEVSRTGGRHGLGHVPVRVLRWQEQLDRGELYGLSQVQGVLPLTLALFGNESELADHLASSNFALLAFNGTAEEAAGVVLGSSNGITYAEGRNAPSFISPGSEVAMQYTLRSEQLVAAIYTAAKVERPGAQQTPGDAASGIARAYDFAQTDAVLQTFARQLARFEYELVETVAAWDALGSAEKVAAAKAATTIVYPTRYDAAGIRDDLGAMFAALDDKVRAQLPPTVIREARMGIARGLFPEASPAVEASTAAEVEGMYLADVAAMGAAHPDPAVGGAAAAADAMAALPLADAGALTTATP